MSTASLPALVLPNGSSSSSSPMASSSRTRWTPADPVMPSSYVSLANSSFEEDHYEIGLETLKGFCDGEMAPSVSHLLILLHLSLTHPLPPSSPSIQRFSLSLFTSLSSIYSPRSILLAVPPNDPEKTGSDFHDERDISSVEQVSRRIIRWRNWSEGVIGSKPGQARAPRREEDREDGGWEVGMGRRAKTKGGGAKGAEREVVVEEGRWWEVTKVLVGLWERDLRECREWSRPEEGEEGELEQPLPMFLTQFPTDGSSNLRKPRSDIASLVKAIFSTYPSSSSSSSKGKSKGQPLEDEAAVDFSRMEEGTENEKSYEQVMQRRETAGRLMGLILTLTTPPTPFLSPSRYNIHLLTPLHSSLPTSHLPLFVSFLPVTTPNSAILVLLASILGIDPDSEPPNGEVFVRTMMNRAAPGGRKSLRFAVVKVLMMGRLGWKDESGERRMSSTPSAGSLIWTSVRPLLKISFATLSGFVLAKQGMFPAQASKGFSYIVMNLTLPCLIFASIVPSFNSENIASIGPLAMTACFYEVTGLVMALIVREFFWVPKEFQWGILIMGAFSNWANLPTAVTQSVALGPPFNPATDPDLGVGFVAVFILIYNVTFFTGASKICGWDFHDLSPEGPREGFVAKWARRRRWLDAKLGRGRNGRRDSSEAEEGGGGLEMALPELGRSVKGEKSGSEEKTVKDREPTVDVKTLESTTSQPANLRPTDSSSINHRLPPPATTPSNGSHISLNRSRSPSSRNPPPSSTSPPYPNPRPSSPIGKLPMTTLGAVNIGLKAALSCLLTPITLSLLIALICALIPPIKALFVLNVDGWSGTKIKLAPDGRPALAFIQETAVFIGAICVPGALILLGASFARLKVPRDWSNLPVGAILAIAATKMIILPVIGVGFVQGLGATTTLFPKDEKILSFVAMFLSGSPAAVLQLVVTQLQAPDEGKTDVLAAFPRPSSFSFLLAQYVFLFFSSTALTAVSLKFVS
ncbi:membrane transport protein-domain-containing protein [Mrakia frigida]|uniref:membrane transport protein-domain-containing protein n=1 Tax=Mrakia frigida TaxID=29902 RepID=UPI003FCC2370